MNIFFNRLQHAYWLAVHTSSFSCSRLYLEIGPSMFKNHGSSYKCVEKVRYLRAAVCRVQFFSKIQPSFLSGTLASKYSAESIIFIFKKVWIIVFARKYMILKYVWMICYQISMLNIYMKKNKRASRSLKKLRTSSLGLLIVTIFIKQKQKLLPWFILKRGDIFNIENL